MKLQKLNISGIAHIFVPMLAIVAIGAVGTYSLVSSHANSIHRSVRFKGTITQDECATTRAPIGDVGCNITVGTRVVYVAHGNIRQTKPWGRTIGFASLKANYVGKKVEVYAGVTANHAYTLEGSASYYVRIVANQTPPPAVGHISGFVYLKSGGGANCGNSCTASPGAVQAYKATVAVKTVAGAPVTTFTSASNGAFSVAVAAGTSVLVPQSSSEGNIHAPNQTVQVSQGGTTNVTITYTLNAPAPPPPPAPTPAPVSTIKHPTAADCKATPKMTVYASAPNGTPAYSYASANQNQSARTVIYTVQFGTAITDVYCNDAGTWLYHYDGNNVYSTYNPADVSLTKP